MPAKKLPKSAEQKRKKNQNVVESVESFGTEYLAAVIMPNPQNSSDEEKMMYLAFRNEMRSRIAWESEYDYYWMDHFSGDSETLTMMIEDDEEDRKDSVIERLIKRQKYNEAFHVWDHESGSQWVHIFLFFMPSIMPSS
jgi:hypothetical protein